jgi:hypothetical protein
LGAPQSEIGNEALASNPADAGSFGCNQGGEVEQVQHQCLQQLRLQQPALDTHQRFAWEDHLAFGDAPDGAAEAEGAQVLQELFAEAVRSEVLQVLLGEAQFQQGFQQVAQPCKDHVSAAEGIAAEEVLEDRRELGASAQEVALRHRELVEVGIESKVLQEVTHWGCCG